VGVQASRYVYASLKTTTKATAMRTMLALKTAENTRSLSFRATDELRRRVASHVRKGVPGSVGYFATGADFMHAAVLEKIERMDASQTS